MSNLLKNKRVIIVDQDVTFRELCAQYLRRFGALVDEVEEGHSALRQCHTRFPDLLITDLRLPGLSGLEVIEILQSQGVSFPILVLSSSEEVNDIAKAMRLGVADLFLKPLCSMEHLHSTILSCLYPNLYASEALQQIEFIHEWQMLCDEHELSKQLIRQLQPPIVQSVSHCQVNYRNLSNIDEMGLVLDIAALSEEELAFYCLDITRVGEQGVLAALLLRTLFNTVLKDNMARYGRSFPHISVILKKIEHLLHLANLKGQFPLLIGYYHRPSAQLLLVSAGLSAEVKVGTQSLQLHCGIPIGTLPSLHFNQLKVYGMKWCCQIRGKNTRLHLMLSATS